MSKKEIPPRVPENPKVDFFLCRLGCGFGFVFQLCGGAVLGRDVLTFTEIDGLVDAAAFLEGIEESSVTDLSDCRDPVVRRDGYLACWDDSPAIFREQAEGDAALGVVAGDDEGRALDKLELQLAAAGVGTAWAEGCVDLLEDDPLAAAAAEGLEHGAFLPCLHVSVHGAQVLVFGVEEGEQPGETRQVGVAPDVVAFNLKEVEGVEGIAYRLAVDEDIHGEFLQGVADGFRDGDEEASAVDAGDLVPALPDHEAASVELFLEADGIAAEEPVEFGFVNGVEELAADAAVLSVGGADASELP